MSTPAPPDFDRVVDDTVTYLLSGLAASFYRPRTWATRPWDAEHRKLYGRLLASLEDLRRLERDVGPLDPATRARLAQLLSVPRALASTDSTLELVDEVRKALVPKGDAAYLRALLVDEWAREHRRSERRLAGGGGPASPLVGWSVIYPDRPADELLAETADAGWIDEVRERLAALYETRRERYRLQRARTRIKADYLMLVGGVLLALDAAVAVVVAILGGGVARTALAALAGALGGTVSGAFRLRDEVDRLNEVRAFKPALWVQPLVGAAAGLVLLLVLRSGLLGGNGTSWEKVGLIAFAGGFSEPFFLGVVKRVTSADGSR